MDFVTTVNLTEHNITLNDISLYDHRVEKHIDKKTKKITKIPKDLVEPLDVKCDKLYDDFLQNAEVLKHKLEIALQNIKSV